MIEPLTGFHELRSNPQIMIKGKASPFFLPRRGNAENTSDSADKVARSKTPMSEDELRVLQELKLRDSAVREEEESGPNILLSKTA